MIRDDRADWKHWQIQAILWMEIAAKLTLVANLFMNVNTDVYDPSDLSWMTR